MSGNAFDASGKVTQDARSNLAGRHERVATMQSELSDPDSARVLVQLNRRFYDGLWSGARLVDPQRFNTWPLVQSLLEAGG